jgi:hypothetical protein
MISYDDLTVGDLLDFVIAHKTNKSFVGYTIEQIAYMLDEHIRSNTVWWTKENNKISGMMVGTVDEKAKIIFIDENLAMNLNNLKKFATRAKQMYRGYKLMWRKNGIYKNHNTDKVYEKLSIK